MEEDRYRNFVNDFSDVLYSLTNGKCFSEIICLCIGSDRVTGDTFGPLVGDKLKCLFKDEDCVKVIGTLNNTVNSNNISEIIKTIENEYENPFIIAIDSAISNYKKPGEIAVSNESVTLAARNE